MVDSPTLEDIERRQKIIQHELEDLAKERPVGGEYITIAFHKSEELLLNVQKAQEKQKAQGN